MPCSEVFWQAFMPHFGEALGLGLGALPIVAAFWGGMAGFAYVLNRAIGHGTEARRRVDALERRVIDFESHRQRSGGAGA